MNMKRLILLGLSLLIVRSALAWGQKGHDVTAYIAECHLTPAAAKKIDKVLDGHSPVYYANWLDNASHTPDYAYTKTWHYLNVDEGKTLETMPANPKGDVLKAVTEIVAKLKAGGLTHEEEALQLKMLIHLVGDMHCPAHIKYATHDMKYDVLFEDKYRKAHKFYVHSVWDNEIITVSRIWSVSEWADELDRLPKSDKQAIAAGTPRDWLHDAAVCCEVQFEWAKPDARLGQDFLNKALPLVESQIRKAGYRLARLLNGLFD